MHGHSWPAVLILLPLLNQSLVLQFPKEQYATDISENASLARLEVVAKLKRNSTGFSR